MFSLVLALMLLVGLIRGGLAGFALQVASEPAES
jgi:hypothetical protein